MQYKNKIISYAKELGFDLVAFTKAKIDERYLKGFEDWLENGNEGTMEYMQKISQRRDLTKILPGAKSVIVLATNYYYEQAPLKNGYGRVARYAYGRDYHKIIGKKLRQLETFVESLAVGEESTESSARSKITGRQRHAKSYVDTGPILERALAEQSGIGVIGKNGCVITREFGSWVFLSEIITTLDLAEPTRFTAQQNLEFDNGLRAEAAEPTNLATQQNHGLDNGLRAEVAKSANLTTQQIPEQSPHVEKRQNARLPRKPPQYPDTISRISSSFTNSLHAQPKPPNICGNCTKCIDACPTGAIIAPGVIDSRLCISYLTIENKDKIPPKLARAISKSKRIYGCDICQEVCPHNEAKQRIHTHIELSNPSIAGDQLSIKKLSTIKTNQKFLETFAGSPLMRAKLSWINRLPRF